MLEKHHDARFRLAFCRYPRVPRMGVSESVDLLDVWLRGKGYFQPVTMTTASLGRECQYTSVAEKCVERWCLHV